MIVVLANSVMLASHDYMYRMDPEVEKITDFEKTASKVFFAIFITEFVLKVIAMGFVVKKYSYIRDYWNVLDFICLLTAVMENISTDEGNNMFTMLRVLRVLKPLRSVKAIP